MQPDWQTRPEEEQEPVNPFAPIDYASRLHSGARPGHSSAAQPRPGSLYGGLSPMKPIQPPQQWSAPPAPAAGSDIPSYLKKKPAQPEQEESPRRRSRVEEHRQQEMPLAPEPEWTSPSFAPQGTPYAQMQFDAPPVPPRQEIPPLDEIAAFFSQEPLPAPAEGEEAEVSAFFDDPADFAPEEDAAESFKDAFAPAAPAPAPPPAEEPALKDAYAPAREDDRAAAPKPVRPPVRIWRVAALCSAAAMLLFCGVVGLRTLTELSRNERDIQSLKQEYRQQTGQDLQNAASRVELLPPGQTYAPTTTPAPTMALHTPTPAPIIPINEAAIAYLNPHSDEQTDPAEQTVSTPLRTKQTTYPDNPLQNIMESLVELRRENADVTGHLRIEGLLDEVVVQRDQMYYLTHDWQGSYSAAGAVFMDENCSLKIPPENLLLRGQCGDSRSSFGPLLSFATGGPSFAGQYGFATLTTLYEECRYRLFAVIVTPSDPTRADYFSYSSYPTFGSDAEMLTYVEKAKARSLYDFGVDVAAGDRLLTLATVGSGNDCLVLVYRMARTGE